MQTFKIVEHFHSIQGEGFLTGTPMIFIRFAGCNLNCSFCDTKWNIGAQTTLDEILEWIEITRASWVCLSGGEPALQCTEKLVAGIHKAGKRAALETNGTLWNPSFAYIDHVTISPKPETTIAQEWISRRVVDELRFLITPQHPFAHSVGLTARHLYVSPIFNEDGRINKTALSKAIKFVLNHPQFSLSVQLHKLIGVK